MSHHVYMVSGPAADAIYIGYCKNDGSDALTNFLIGANRSEEDRRDVQFIHYHGDARQLTAKVVAAVEDEWEAFVLRNELRARYVTSFSGPSQWPTGAYKRAQELKPERVKEAMDVWKMRQLKTAREAYSAGLWTFVTIKNLCGEYGKVRVMDDLKVLSPDTFAKEYQLS